MNLMFDHIAPQLKLVLSVMNAKDTSRIRQMTHFQNANIE